MPLKPVKGVGIRTAKDEQRARDREEARAIWAAVDREIEDALSASATIPMFNLEDAP